MEDVLSIFGITVATATAVAVLAMEIIKFIVRKVMQKPDYDFPAAFYAVGIPVLAYLGQPLLGWLGIAGYEIPTDWQTFFKQLLIVLISSGAALFSYDRTIAKLKAYNKARQEG